MRFDPSSRTIALVRPAISKEEFGHVRVSQKDSPGSRHQVSVAEVFCKTILSGVFVRPGSGVRTLMAFGFGFNKQKVLSAAEKYIQQGKTQNAIAEYEKILKADPKDLTVTNPVGDLYSRLGE